MSSRGLPRLPAVRDLIKLYGLSAKSQLSQNFILDKNVTDKIAKCANIIPESSVVVEVGPEASGGRLKVIQGDMLKVDHMDILARFGNPTSQDPDTTLHLVGNLPFSVATPLLAQWLGRLWEKSGFFARHQSAMTLMFQKEVADRIVAPVSTSPRGRLSVAAQSLCRARLAYNLPGSSFVPRPKVDAAVVHLTPLDQPLLAVTFAELEHVSRFLFSSRRKTLRRIMRNWDDRGLVCLEESDLDANVRPQDLTTEQFNRLAASIVRSNLVMPP
ncbi:hypothetical protein IWQ60_001929 [Tieghemiomyces parasiticus]|uniref:rRNA adenine N(6)-methyltransferase n=1 Tax=Tieghemiomyces parasiticus TaxID=78921 RepID=A0A9W8AC63_9FUNG|nr:hypothetical protein IWQ60_001929 [Tieghemiomyces parasiticus]